MLQAGKRILFFGSDEFSVICCNRLLRASKDGVVSNLEIVTPPDNPRTKQPEVPLKRFARENSIPHHLAPPKTLTGWTPPTSFDLAVVVSFGYFLPSPVIGAFPLRALNVHPSLLPKYRGAAPIQHTILNGDTKTGVSIMELDEKKFDAGRILHQSSLDVGPYPFYKELHDRLAVQGAEDLVKTVSQLHELKEHAWLQNLDEVTHARKIETAMSAIDWAAMSREGIYCRHRALGYKTPLYCQFREKRVQILSMTLQNPTMELPADASPGSLVYDKEASIVFVKCQDGWIGVDSLKVAGKKDLNAKAFFNGYQLTSRDQFVPA
ncbi:hypothetical protein HDU81_010308 [Chytriomyces hyalinus]|nr:hypothetical protein HDU81_010308 [Chytriomyces hyalinus]